MRRHTTILSTLIATACAWGPLQATEELERGSPAHYTSLGISAHQREQFESAITSYQAAPKDKIPASSQLDSISPGSSRTGHPQHRSDPALRSVCCRPHPLYRGSQGQREHQRVLCNLGIIAYHQGEWQQAAHYFRDAADSADEPVLIASYAFNLATAPNNGNWNDARRAYERALSLDDTHFAAHYNLSFLLLTQLDNPAEAERYLQRAHELDATRPEPLLNLAVLAEQRGRGNQKTLYDQAISAAPQPNLSNDHDCVVEAGDVLRTR